MLVIAALLFLASLLSIQMPKLIALQSYRDEVVGYDKAVQKLSSEPMGPLTQSLITFGSLFIFLPLIVAIPILNPLLFIFPAGTALIKGLLGVRTQLVDLSRGAFYADKFISGDLARRLATFQLVIVMLLILFAYLLVGDFRIDL